MKNKKFILIVSLMLLGIGVICYNIVNSETNMLTNFERELDSEEKGLVSEPNWREMKSVDILEMIANNESVEGLNEARDSNDWWNADIANDIKNLHTSFNNMFWEWEETIDFNNQEDIEYLNSIQENLNDFNETTKGHKMNKDIHNAYLALSKAINDKDKEGLEVAHTIIHDLDIFYNGYKVNKEKPAAESFDDKPFLVTHYNDNDTSSVDDYISQ